MGRDKSQAAEVHVMYEVHGERMLHDSHDLYGEECNDAVDIGLHSKADADRIVVLLKELGFDVELRQRTARILERTFPDPPEEEK